MKLNIGFCIKLFTYLIVFSVIVWWINGCSLAWFEHKPSPEEAEAFNDSIRIANEKIEKEHSYYKYHDVDQPEEEPEGGVITLRVSTWGRGNEYSALPDIVIKKWSNHNGDIKKCRAQFIETEKERGKYFKISETYITDVVIENNTVKFYSPHAFTGSHLGESAIIQQDWVNRRTTKLKDCKINRVLFYDSWNEKEPRFLSEYVLTKNGTFRESEQSVEKKVKRGREAEIEKLKYINK